MERWKKILALGILLVLALLCIVYALADPSSSILFPKCPVKLLTGMQCPSCGVQRALHSLLQGRLLEALSYNYWFILSIPSYTLISFFSSSGGFSAIFWNYRGEGIFGY